VALQGLTTLAITLFLLVAGLEVDLSAVFRQGRSAICVSLGGIIIPFAIGFGVGWFGPILLSPQVLGQVEGGDRLIFALFLATAMSISALPVIAKTLMDLNMYRSDLGMTVIASAVFDDLIGWVIFAIVLGMMGASGDGYFPIGMTIGLVLAYTAVMLTFGRFVLHRSLPYVQAHTKWPGGVLGFAVALAMQLAADVAEADFAWTIGSLCQINRIPFDPALLRDETESSDRSSRSLVLAWGRWLCADGYQVDRGSEAARRQSHPGKAPYRVGGRRLSEAGPCPVPRALLPTYGTPLEVEGAL
jgi:hypothetical protein